MYCIYYSWILDLIFATTRLSDYVLTSNKEESESSLLWTKTKINTTMIPDSIGDENQKECAQGRVCTSVEL